MGVVQDIMRRTGADQSEAELYAEKARRLIERRCTGITWTEDVTDAQADIAVLLWQRDTAGLNLVSTLGLASESFSEGGVSVKTTTASGSSILSSYNSQVEDIIATLKGQSKAQVRFL